MHAASRESKKQISGVQNEIWLSALHFLDAKLQVSSKWFWFTRIKCGHTEFWALLCFPEFLLVLQRSYHHYRPFLYTNLCVKTDRRVSNRQGKGKRGGSKMKSRHCDSETWRIELEVSHRAWINWTSMDTRMNAGTNSNFSALKSFKVLTFDCYGTLIDWEKVFIRFRAPRRPHNRKRTKTFRNFTSDFSRSVALYFAYDRVYRVF